MSWRQDVLSNGFMGPPAMSGDPRRPDLPSPLRSLGAHLNVNGIESFMVELAAAGADPVGVRLAHLTDPRPRKVTGHPRRGQCRRGLPANPPGRVINQVERGAMPSARWTLHEQVRFDRDRITSAAWDGYQILRFTET